MKCLQCQHKKALLPHMYPTFCSSECLEKFAMVYVRNIYAKCEAHNHWYEAGFGCEACGKEATPEQYVELKEALIMCSEVQEATIYIVIGSSGKYQLDSRWAVAAFLNKDEAHNWCGKCSEFGMFVSRMETYAQKERESLKPGQQIQWDWAVRGSLEENKEWKRELLDKGFSHTEIEERRAQEVSWMLNPYDPFIPEQSGLFVSYFVVYVPLNPKPPLIL